MQQERRIPRTAEDWQRMEDELAKWGRKLDDLRGRADRVGEGLVEDLERRYDAVKRETEALRRRTQRELQEARRKIDGLEAEAGDQPCSVFAPAGSGMRGRVPATEQDVREEFSRAWRNLRNGFQQACERLGQIPQP